MFVVLLHVTFMAPQSPEAHVTVTFVLVPFDVMLAEPFTPPVPLLPERLRVDWFHATIGVKIVQLTLIYASVVS